MTLGQKARLGFTKAHCTATTAALHLTHEEEPEADNNDQRKNRADQIPDIEAAAWLFIGNVHARSVHLLDKVILRVGARCETLIGDCDAMNGVAIHIHAAHFAIAGALKEFRIADLGAALRCICRLQIRKECDQKGSNDSPEGDIAHVHVFRLSSSKTLLCIT